MSNVKKVKKVKIGKDIQNYLLLNNAYHSMRKGNKAVGYCRTSRKRRTSEINLKQQEMLIRDKGKEKKLTLVKVYDEGVRKGAKTNRPIFAKMIEEIKRNTSITTIIVSSLDRLTREGDEIALELHKIGVNLISARENTDILTSDTLFLTRKLLLDAKMEHIKKSASTNLARKRMLLNGVKTAIPPFGYKNSTSRDGKSAIIIIDKKVSNKVKRTFELFSKGLTMKEIMKKLRFTKSDIKLRQIANLLRDPFYIGIIKDKSLPYLVNGSHTPLISTGLYRKCLLRLGLI
jgi:DNA invertase Pin-like site-specific DNA recombinase